MSVTGIALSAALFLMVIPQAQTPVTPTVYAVGYTEFAFTAPAVVPSGYNSFRATNRGKELHHATLVKLDDGKSAADFVEAVKKSGPPSWATPVGGMENSAEVTIHLLPGNYIWLCTLPSPDGTSHFAKGMWRAMTVSKEKSSGKQPAADIVVTMKDDGKSYGWVVTKPLTAGHHVLKVVNDGQPHEFMLVQLAPGKNTNDFLSWIDKQAGPRPFISIEGVPTLESGGVNFVTVDLKRGLYGVLSFNPDARDGKPQFVHGMVRQIEIK